MINTTMFEEKNAAPVALSRPLNENVMQSAEQAVLSNPASDGRLAAPGDQELASAGVLARYRAALASQVARKPGQSALIALAMGALVAAGLRSVVNRRRR